MKTNIIINNKEIYSIEIPDEMTLDDLSGLDFRISNILKVFSKDVFKISNKIKNNSNVEPNEEVKTEKRYKSKNHKNEQIVFNTRDKAIEIIKLFNHGTKEEIDTFCKKYNIDKNYISAKMWNIREKKYQIKAHEVGLSRYLNKSEIRDVNARASIRLPYFRWVYPSNLNFLE